MMRIVRPFLLLCAVLLGAAAGASEQWRTAHLRGECEAALTAARAAAEKGEPEAMLQMSDWHFFGTCLDKDDVASARWALLAAEAGLPRAQVVAGQIHASGLGVAKDEAVARDWYQKAADAGDPEGMLLLAKVFEADAADPLAAELALAWTRRAADKEYAPAFVHLAALYSGGGRQTDYGEAARWLEKAIQAGYRDNGVWVALSWACLNLGRYDEVLEAVQKVPKEAPEYKAAQINMAHALLLNGQVGNAREVYAQNMTLRGKDEFRRVLREDFTELRRSGHPHPGMLRMEKLFLSDTSN
ncbi:tetratricopeptide repeat protein [Methyloversatilis thermotolerans]|uniref:tetratricopeptide repeat protein n=1 Tax=Methyloversatilis thermotolerans TaxID=1346290 RepID=UPI0003646043|nr:tetratricopeptide repeat protein [Methyloversatilis thermotolerans]